MKKVIKQKAEQQQSEAEYLLDLLTDGDISSALKYQVKHPSKDELSRKAHKIAKNIANYLEIMDALSQGDFNRHPPQFSGRDQIGTSIARVIESISSTAKTASDVKLALESEKSKLLQEDWVKSQYTSVFSKIQGVKTVADLGNIVLTELSAALNVQMGAFFVRQTDSTASVLTNTLTNILTNTLNLVATYGVRADEKRKIFQLGEGVIGQCAVDLRPRYLEKVPHDFIQIESGLGKIKPSCVVVMPIAYEGELYGVFELASLDIFTDIQKRLLEQVANSIGISIKSIAGNMLTEKLLEEIAQKNNTLASQKQALDSSAIVAETDTRGKITYVNDKFLQISKYDRSELMGQDHRILNSGHHPKEFFIDLWKTISKGEVWHNEVRNKAKDGTYYWVDTTVYPVKDEHGKPQKYVAIRFDITDKKRALEELQLATQQAKNAAKVKTEFLANMSHEIRTPMNAIIGMAELLKETPLNIDQERYVSVLNNSGSALLDVINNILDLSKIEAGHLDLEQIPYDLEDVIYSTTEIMGRSAHKKGLELVSSIEPCIKTELLGDPSRLRQVIINLLGNAIKFTKTGEIRLRVEKTSSQDGFMTVTVSDTGIGIAQDKLVKLFQNFSQANASTTREYGGTGLGLSISKKIVEMMGGSIGVKSVEGQGSQFYFSIPILPQESQQSPPLDLSLLKGKRALVVDDNMTNRLVLKEMLTSWQMSVDEADDGPEAIEKIKSENQSANPFQLVLLDYHMPKMNGIEVAKRLSENSLKHPITIVMLTSEDKRSSLGRARSMGITSYVIKPIRRVELLKITLAAFTQASLKPTILVVDDEIEIYEMTSDLLKELKVNVLTASGGKEALEILKKESIQIIISDLKMPEMNGLEFLEEARKAGQNQPFIFISGYIPQFKADAIAGMGDVDFFDKPYDNGALLNLVDDRLERLSLGEHRKTVNVLPSATTKPLNILVVDDVTENADLIKVYLKKFPYNLDFAANGQEAIEKFLTSKYNLILMDIQMPVMDGHEATRRIRKIETEKKLSHTPIISLSAHALSEEMQNSLAAGSDAYLTKPIKKVPLLEAIEKYSNLGIQRHGIKDVA